MNKSQLIDLRNILLATFAPLPCGSVSDWCASNITLPPPQTQEPGPMLFDGREYLVDVLQDFGDPTVTDSVCCFGSQSGKTTALMGGVAWTIVNDPAGILWVMPSAGLAQSFSETRWQPMILASDVLEKLVPKGARRHDFKKTQQQIGASIVNFIGSNSPGNLASRPARVVILDEVDKFDEGGKGEADAVNLAEQRTKSFSNPKRIKTSTPTLTEGLIWQEFLKGSMERYNVPCPSCSKFVVLCWSKNYTALRLTGNEAFVVWDKEARKEDGSWDLERVEKSARCQCPFCGGDIEDGQKTRMVRSGKWVATNANASISFKSRHLPSLYASSPETSFGRLAVKFLTQKRSLLGLQGFINGDLAEPYAAQDTLGQRTELVRATVETEDWHPIMTVDCQAKAPYFWFVVRKWQNGNSHAIDAGPLQTWDEVHAKQLEHGVDDVAVFIDSGFGARSDADVYAECAKSGSMVSDSGRSIHMGWVPCKGQPGRKKYKDQNGSYIPYFIRNIDPYLGSAKAGRVEMPLLEFSGDLFKDILEALRQQKGGYEWSVADSVATEDYWRHMDGEVKSAQFNRLTGVTRYQWQLRSKHWPNHMFDCEVMQIAAANYLGVFSYEKEVQNEQ